VLNFISGKNTRKARCKGGGWVGGLGRERVIEREGRRTGREGRTEDKLHRKREGKRGKESN
jgi:hypothetical protein